MSIYTETGKTASDHYAAGRVEGYKRGREVMRKNALRIIETEVVKASDYGNSRVFMVCDYERLKDKLRKLK